ncbi:MAG: spondin domain-containing protein [Gammaproteobacteria bacterium]|nr:spondin domain-containing protein [Gammaproteobacteria bacterium]
MNKILATTITLLALAVTTPSYATNTATVEITNITHGSYFTPLLVVAHHRNIDLFEVGEAASVALEKVAEAGDVVDLQGIAEGLGASVDIANDTPLGPGETATAEVSITGGNRRISVVAMVLPTNDAFVGLDSVRVPPRHRNHIFLARAYDAGTEVNDELLAPGEPGATGPGIPGDPTGQAGGGGTGATTVELNTHIHVHPGVVGDNDPTGGISDLDSAIHNWQNPVARIVISR